MMTLLDIVKKHTLTFTATGCEDDEMREGIEAACREVLLLAAREGLSVLEQAVDAVRWRAIRALLDDAHASEPQPAQVDPWRALLEGEREKHAAVVRHHREQYLFDLAAKSREIVAYIDDLLERGPR